MERNYRRTIKRRLVEAAWADGGPKGDKLAERDKALKELRLAVWWLFNLIGGEREYAAFFSFPNMFRPGEYFQVMLWGGKPGSEPQWSITAPHLEVEKCYTPELLGQLRGWLDQFPAD